MDDPLTDEAAIERQTGPNPAASMIWLHGLGADGHDFENLVPELRFPPSTALRFVFPHAPFRPVTINGGTVMRAWYDIAVSERGLAQNIAHVRESENILRQLIEKENMRGISSTRVVLAGFSQGGAIALHTGLRFPDRLAGIVVLSAPVPDAETLLQEVQPANATVPIFLAHGTEDDVIPLAMVQPVHEQLHARRFRLEAHRYRMGHTVVEEEIRDLARWLGVILEEITNDSI